MSFDPNSFLSAIIDTPLSTETLKVPEGEYVAVIDDFDEKAFRAIPSKNGGPDRVIFACPWVIQDEAVKAQLGREKVTVRQDIWLDFTADGQLDTSKGKNVDLGRIREAVGQNRAGAWTIMHLRGAGPAMIQVNHRTDEKSGAIYDQVRRVARIG